jgi:cytoplasmic tRNA 2-thiolation protein 2
MHSIRNGGKELDKPAHFKDIHLISLMKVRPFSSSAIWLFICSHAELFLKARSDDSSTPTASLRSYITSLPTQTAVATAIRNLTRMLLLYTAASTQCSHLLLGTSLTSLSISLISSISQGGGYSVKEEAQEEWTYKNCNQSERTVRIIRPLRDVGVKECAFWAWWCDLKVVRRHRFSGGRQDISALTRGTPIISLNFI